MIGIDIVKIERIERLTRRFGKKALDRFLTNEEQKIAQTSNTQAGFWATKEAFSKALGVGIGKEFSFFDIRIYKDEKKAPKIKVAEHIIEKFAIDEVTLSITHDGGFAIAVVVVRSFKKEALKSFSCKA